LTGTPDWLLDESRKLMPISGSHGQAHSAALMRVTDDVNLAASLRRLATAGSELLPACRSASVTVIVAGRAVTMAATDDTAASLDCTQYDVDDGPCLVSAREEQVVRLDDLAAPGPWPEYRRNARQHNIVSSLSVPLLLEDADTRGAFNLYGVRAFSADEGTLAEAFATDASVVVTNVVAYWSAVDLSRNLAVALEHRGVIEQAKGTLIADNACTPDQAFDMLRQRSQTENRKLRVVAIDVVAEHQRHAFG